MLFLLMFLLLWLPNVVCETYYICSVSYYYYYYYYITPTVVGWCIVILRFFFTVIMAPKRSFMIIIVFFFNFLAYWQPFRNFKNEVHNFEWWSIFVSSFKRIHCTVSEKRAKQNWSGRKKWNNKNNNNNKKQSKNNNAAPYGNHFGLLWRPFWILNGHQNTKILRFG
jgi:hypothetical protein